MTKTKITEEVENEVTEILFDATCLLNEIEGFERLLKSRKLKKADIEVWEDIKALKLALKPLYCDVTEV